LSRPARAPGQPELPIALRHVLPNSLTPALIHPSVTIGFAILLTAGLSFVGAGVRPPTPEWGLMISTGANQIIPVRMVAIGLSRHRDCADGVRFRRSGQRVGAAL